MINYLARQIPAWAHPSHPILQYELAHVHHTRSRRQQIVAIFFVMLGLGLGGYLYAINAPADDNITAFIWRVLYFPLVLMQVLTSIVALAYGVASVNKARSQNTWDALRTTENGTAFALRARWIAILYRLRLPILMIMLARIILIIGMLRDVGAYDGLYLVMLTANLSNTLPIEWLGLWVIALIMTLNILLPLTMIAFATGLGILISVMVHTRIYAVTAQIFLTMLQLITTIGMGLALSQTLNGTLSLSKEALFALVLGYSSFGDWGLLYAQLNTIGELWSIVPYGLFIAVILVAVMLLQHALTDGMLSLAVHLSESHE